MSSNPGQSSPSCSVSSTTSRVRVRLPTSSWSLHSPQGPTTQSRSTRVYKEKTFLLSQGVSIFLDYFLIKSEPNKKITSTIVRFVVTMATTIKHLDVYTQSLGRQIRYMKIGPGEVMDSAWARPNHRAYILTQKSLATHITITRIY